MVRTFTENIKPMPRELEYELLIMNAIEQTDFLLSLSQRYEIDFSNIIKQYQALGEEVRSSLTKEEQTNVINMLKTLIEYLEDDEEEE